MKTVKRTQHITELELKIVDLKTEKISEIKYVLESWFSSEKIMRTKLDEEMKSLNLKIIQVISTTKLIRTYEQTLDYFRANAQTVTDEVYATLKEEK